jgi:hypothetical protein
MRLIGRPGAEVRRTAACAAVSLDRVLRSKVANRLLMGGLQAVKDGERRLQIVADSESAASKTAPLL